MQERLPKKYALAGRSSKKEGLPKSCALEGGSSSPKRGSQKLCFCSNKQQAHGFGEAVVPGNAEDAGDADPASPASSAFEIEG